MFFLSISIIWLRIATCSGAVSVDLNLSLAYKHLEALLWRNLLFHLNVISFCILLLFFTVGVTKAG